MRIFTSSLTEIASMQKLDVYRKNVYGIELVYVADASMRELIKVLTNSESLAARHIEALQGLGFELTEVLPPLKEVRGEQRFSTIGTPRG